MKKYIFIIVMITLIALFTILTPRENEKISVYQNSDSHLLLPQKNVVIVTINLQENNLSLDNLNTLTMLEDLNNQFKQIQGVNSIDSILNATVISSYLDDIEVKPFLGENITSEELSRELKNSGTYPELKPYISLNGDSLLFYIYFGYSTLPTNILSDIENVSKKSPILFSFTGKSPIIAITENLLSKDILIFIPLLFILIMGIFFTFRSWKAILAAWVIILLSVIFSFSLTKYLGVKITLKKCCEESVFPRRR